MGVEKVRKDDTARTFEFLFRFNRVWINSRLLLLLLLDSRQQTKQSRIRADLTLLLGDWADNRASGCLCRFVAG